MCVSVGVCVYVCATMPLPLPARLVRSDCALLRGAVQAYGTPLQLYDEAGIRECAEKVITTFTARFPGMVQFFAVKALPNPAILALLVQASVRTHA
ncbi:MAG: hypothetical protein EOO65_02855 [Methanosarcinales archaeon]|nr:MAG: hypothetical protein EOO65_02855 [Methanosarcinales archaeon]